MKSNQNNKIKNIGNNWDTKKLFWLELHDMDSSQTQVTNLVTLGLTRWIPKDFELDSNLSYSWLQMDIGFEISIGHLFTLGGGD